MRAEWEFWCEAYGFRLEREHKYSVAATGEIKLPARTFESFAFSVRLRPTNGREPADGGDQALLGT